MENASLKLELNSVFMACKEGQFDVVELMVNNQFKAFSINLNAQTCEWSDYLAFHSRKLAENTCTVNRYSKLNASTQNQH